MEFSESLELLRRTALFGALDDASLATIAAQLRNVTVEAGERVFRKGDQGGAMYVVVDGEFRVHDEHTVFRHLGPGDAFGEYALLESVTRTATVTALTRGRLVAVGKDLFLGLIRDQHTFAHAVIKGLIASITHEKDRSERLLQSILPQEVAHEYETQGRVGVRHYDRVTVLITDFVGFSRISEQLPPAEVIAQLDECFTAFDRIADRFGVQRIKTTGDGYMCVGGVPTPNETNPVDVVLAGLAMQRFMHGWVERRQARELPSWTCRIGINTGECIAAVIGGTHLTYDVWSDAVNVASRIESGCKPGAVSIGAATHALVHEFFDCEPRGEITAKHERRIETHTVRGVRPQLSLDAHADAPDSPDSQFFALCEERFGSIPRVARRKRSDAPDVL